MAEANLPGRIWRYIFFFKDLIIEDKWRGLSIVFKPQENIYSIYHMSRSSVKYGEMPPPASIYKYFPEK